MYIQTPEMRREFIDGLRVKYARELPTLLIKNQSDIMFGAKHLYNSGTPFDSRGGETKRQPRLQGLSVIESTLTPLVDKFWSYFNKIPAPTSQADFDKVHEDLCDTFLEIFSAAGYTHTYGNAQKFVNVLFKYLACYADADSFEKWFKYCHMALDGYTYNGYRLKYYSDVVHNSLYGHSAGKLTAWSKLSKSEYTKVASDIIARISARPITYNKFLDICALFPILLHIPEVEEDYVLTPFEAEFFIWKIAKACVKKDKNKEYVYPNAFVIRIRRNLSR